MLDINGNIVFVIFIIRTLKRLSKIIFSKSYKNQTIEKNGRIDELRSKQELSIDEQKEFTRLKFLHDKKTRGFKVSDILVIIAHIAVFIVLLQGLDMLWGETGFFFALALSLALNIILNKILEKWGLHNPKTFTSIFWKKRRRRD